MEALVAQLLTLPAAVATVNIGDKDGLTPLHWAATEGSSCLLALVLWHLCVLQRRICGWLITPFEECLTCGGFQSAA